MEADEKQTFVITVRVDADCDEAERLRALRHVMKRLLRNYRMTCIGIEPVETKSEGQQ